MENMPSQPTTRIDFQNIESHMQSLREECLKEISHAADSREEAYLRATVDVLEGLERSLHHYAEEKGHIYPSKSAEPWD
jgi:hypothetical protein